MMVGGGRTVYGESLPKLHVQPTVKELHNLTCEDY
jgi:hypothetical protein